MGKKKDEKFEKNARKYGFQPDELTEICDNMEKFVYFMIELSIPPEDRTAKILEAVDTVEKMVEHLRNGDLKKVYTKEALRYYRYGDDI